MVENFEVEVPISAKGVGTGVDRTSNEDKKSRDKSTKSIQKLTTEIAKGLGLSKIIGEMLGGVWKLLQPLVKVLSLLVFVVMLPFLPLIRFLTKAITGFIKVITGGGTESIIAWFVGFLEVIALVLLGIFGGWAIALVAAVGAIIIIFWEDIANFFTAAWNNIVLPVFEFIGDSLEFIWEVILSIFKFIGSSLTFVWDVILSAFKVIGAGLEWVWKSVILPAFMFLEDIGEWIWKRIIRPAFGFLSDVGLWIWNIVKKPFEWLADIGNWIWDIIKKPFKWLSDKIGDILGWFGFGSKDRDSGFSVGDAIIRPNGQVIRTDPRDTLIATKKPESLVGGTFNFAPTINLNGQISNNMDVRRTAEEIARIAAEELARRTGSLRF